MRQDLIAEQLAVRAFPRPLFPSDWGVWLARLDHDNVLKSLEWYEIPKHIWVITELVTGGSLADILEQDGCIIIPPPHLNGFIIVIYYYLWYYQRCGQG
jgi:hypothetical protein